jgi:hypothetical protein
MAYTRVGSKKASTPIPSDPAVLTISKLANSASAADYTVAVPWDGCRLAYVYTITTTATDTEAGGMAVKLELDTAGGTELGTVSVVTSSAVNTLTEIVWAAQDSARHLSSSNYINIEVDGSTTASGEVDLFLYFEPDTA